MCEEKLPGLQLELDLGFENLEETCADCGKTAFPCWKRSLRSVPTRSETVRPRNMPEERTMEQCQNQHCSLKSTLDNFYLISSKVSYAYPLNPPV